MREKRRKRKEVFTLILVSNTDNRSRQFQFSGLKLRVAAVLAAAICLLFGYAFFRLVSGSVREYGLQKQVEEGDRQRVDLEKNIADTEEQVQTLEEENRRLQQQIKVMESAREAAREEAKKEQEIADPTIPRFYPSDGVGVFAIAFSEEHPFLTIVINSGDNVVAAGDGVVRSVGGSEDYLYSVEIEHSSGYLTRYLCNGSATLRVTEETAVQTGDTLFTVGGNNTDLDYQILFEGTPVDPYKVMQLQE